MRRALLALLIGLCLVWTVPAQAQQRFTQIPVKLQSAAGADGNGSAITVKGYLSVTLQVTGSFTATVNFEGTADGSTWVALKCVNVATDSRVTTVTAAGLVQCNVQGLSSLRARISSWSLGSVTVQGYVMDAVLGSTSGGSGGGGGGDASLAEQQAQTAILTTMDADTGSISTSASALNGKFSSAAAASDSLANPTTTSVIAHNMCYDGATWLRQPRVSDTDAIGVSGNNCRTATMGWNFNGTSWDRIRGAVNALNSAGTGIQAAQIVGQFDDTSPTSITENQFGNLRMSANRNLYGTIRDAAGNERGANVNSTNSLQVTMYDSSGNEVVVPTAGLTSYTAAGASTNATSVKASAGTVYGLSLTNTTTTIYYLRMYNTSSAPTCSSATGYVSTIPIPPAAASGGAGGREITKNIGQAFTTGIGFCVTGGASSTDNTNAATGVFVEILYK